MPVEIVARQPQGEQPAGPANRAGIADRSDARHGPLQGRAAVIGGAHAKVVRFVVEQIPAPLPLEHQVDKALSIPCTVANRAACRPRQGSCCWQSAVSAGAVTRPMGRKNSSSTCLRSGPDPAAAPIPGRSQGVSSTASTCCCSTGPSLRRTLLGQQGGDVLCQRLAPACSKSMVSNRLWSRVPGRAPFGEGEDGRGGRLLFLHGDGGLGGHLVVEAGVASTPCRGRALGREPGVGADPPVPLKLPLERAHGGLPGFSASAGSGAGRVSEGSPTPPRQGLGQVGEGGRQCPGVPSPFAAGSRWRCGAGRSSRLARPGAHRRQPEPGGIDPRVRGHVEQAQVFGEALLVGLGQGLLGAGEIEHGAIARLPASWNRGCRRRGGCK